MMNTVGAKWNAEDCKGARIENGSFKPIEGFPALARAGGALVIAARDPDED